MNKKDLNPQSVFDFFFKINKIPRPSKHEERMITFLEDFAKEHRLDYETDETGNVLIRKAATAGLENLPTLILQRHMDMVCDKVVDKEIDFMKDPITSYIDGEWLKAEGTTLGADDGIGCAMQLALLASENTPHCAIECLFTRDEETGLTGANNLKADMLKGDMLINLDSEEEGLFYVSCAGGKTSTATYIYNKVEAPKGFFFMEATVKGLTGGHSGDDINKKRANAAKLLARYLYRVQEKMPVALVEFHSGKLHNAIPRDGRIVFGVPFAEKENARVEWNVFCSEVEEEFHVTEKNIVWHMESFYNDDFGCVPEELSRRFITAMQAMPTGVFSIVQDTVLGDMPETSNNLAVISTSQNAITVTSSQRSSVMSNLSNITATVDSIFTLSGADKIEHSDGYPAWKMRAESPLREKAKKCYTELFGTEPTIKGVHAGLECGLFARNYPNLDMISVGPTMQGVHSPDEKLFIPSVEKVWKLICEIVKS